MYTRESSDSLHAACTHIDQSIITGLFGRKSTDNDASPKPKRSLKDRVLGRNAVVKWDAHAAYTNLTKHYAHATQHIFREVKNMRYGILFGDTKNQYFRENECRYAEDDTVTAFVVNLCPSGINKIVVFYKDQPTDVKEWILTTLQPDDYSNVQWIINPNDYFGSYMNNNQRPILDTSDGDTLDYTQSDLDVNHRQSASRGYSQNGSRGSSRGAADAYPDSPRENPYTPGVSIAPRAGPPNQHNEYIIHQEKSIVENANTHGAVVPSQSEGNDTLVASLEQAHKWNQKYWGVITLESVQYYMTVLDTSGKKKNIMAKVSTISTQYAQPTSGRHGINTDTWIDHRILPEDDYMYMIKPESYFAMHNKNKPEFVAARTTTPNTPGKKHDKVNKSSKQKSVKEPETDPGDIDKPPPDHPAPVNDDPAPVAADKADAHKTPPKPKASDGARDRLKAHVLAGGARTKPDAATPAPDTPAPAEPATAPPAAGKPAPDTPAAAVPAPDTPAADTHKASAPAPKQQTDRLAAIKAERDKKHAPPPAAAVHGDAKAHAPPAAAVHGDAKAHPPPAAAAHGDAKAHAPPAAAVAAADKPAPGAPAHADTHHASVPAPKHQQDRLAAIKAERDKKHALPPAAAVHGDAKAHAAHPQPHAHDTAHDSVHPPAAVPAPASKTNHHVAGTAHKPQDAKHDAHAPAAAAHPPAAAAYPPAAAAHPPAAAAHPPAATAKKHEPAAQPHAAAAHHPAATAKKHEPVAQPHAAAAHHPAGAAHTNTPAAAVAHPPAAHPKKPVDTVPHPSGVTMAKAKGKGVAVQKKTVDTTKKATNKTIDTAKKAAVNDKTVDTAKKAAVNNKTNGTAKKAAVNNKTKGTAKKAGVNNKTVGTADKAAVKNKTVDTAKKADSSKKAASSTLFKPTANSLKREKKITPKKPAQATWKQNMYQDHFSNTVAHIYDV